MKASADQQPGQSRPSPDTTSPQARQRGGNTALSRPAAARRTKGAMDIGFDIDPMLTAARAKSIAAAMRRRGGLLIVRA